MAPRCSLAQPASIWSQWSKPPPQRLLPRTPPRRTKPRPSRRPKAKPLSSKRHGGRGIPPPAYSDDSKERAQMAITAAQVKELRDTTGAGMMDAKKALTETDGDMDAAVDWLRTKGLAKAAKKSGRTAAEGLVAVEVTDGVGVAVEVNSETDFVAKNADFQKMVAGIAAVALSVDSVDALNAADMGGKPVKDVVTDKIATIGENMSVRRMATVSGGA